MYHGLFISLTANVLPPFAFVLGLSFAATISPPWPWTNISNRFFRCYNSWLLGIVLKFLALPDTSWAECTTIFGKSIWVSKVEALIRIITLLLFLGINQELKAELANLTITMEEEARAFAKLPLKVFPSVLRATAPTTTFFSLIEYFQIISLTCG